MKSWTTGESSLVQEENQLFQQAREEPEDRDAGGCDHQVVPPCPGEGVWVQEHTVGGGGDEKHHHITDDKASQAAINYISDY